MEAGRNDEHSTPESTLLVPVDACVHPTLTQCRMDDDSMRLRCEACGKTVEFPLKSLTRSAEDQAHMLRMTFGEAWVKRMGGAQAPRRQWDEQSAGEVPRD